MVRPTRSTYINLSKEQLIKKLLQEDRGRRAAWRLYFEICDEYNISINNQSDEIRRALPTHTDDAALNAYIERLEGESDCSICLEKLERNVAFIRPCFHRLHQSCLANLKTHNTAATCPCCRGPILPNY